MKPRKPDKAPSLHPPRRVILPGFIKDEDIGLGDAFMQATHALGIRPCGGCERRAAALNRWLVFSRQVN